MKLRSFLAVISVAVFSGLGTSALAWGARTAGQREMPTNTTVAALQTAKLPPKGTAAHAASVRTNPKDGLKYVWIQPGSFVMGCSLGDAQCFDQEKPPHSVKITQGFWMGQTEVTVAAYKRFVAATGRRMPGGAIFNYDWSKLQLPIVNVNWEDGQAYCSWAGGRLPTEAEWEYAARAGSTGPAYGAPDDIAWYAFNSQLEPHPVAAKRPNAFGLFDMLGNAWEWVSDWYDETYYQESPAVDPTGPEGGLQHVLRGGSWGANARFIRVSERIRGFSGDNKGFNTFRCAGQIFKP
jgi:formylglycine-generating enzyme required for sulfatase activity